MEHLGLKLSNRVGGHKLTRENYIKDSNKNNGWMFVTEYLLEEEKLNLNTKKFNIWYLNEMIKHYNSVGIDIAETTIRFKYEYIKGLLKKEESKSDDEYLINIRKYCDKLKKFNIIRTVEEVIISQENMIKNYNLIEDITGKVYSEAYLNNQKENAMRNLDINISFFESLSLDSFNEDLGKFLSNNKKFKKYEDLSVLSNEPGYYLMVLEEYKQVYVGTSKNIRKRIREHWANQKDIDRLIFPPNDIEKSKISIDSFRALDTTSIYAFITEDIYNVEDKLIREFKEEFIVNRIAGGITSGMINVATDILTR